MRRGLLALAVLIGCASFIFQSGVPILGSTRAPSGGGESVVQSKIAGGAFATNPSTTIPYTSNVTSGNILVVWGGASTATAWSTPTGSGTGCSSTTWTVQGTPTTGVSVNQGAWVGTASGTGSCTVTIANTGASSWLAGAGFEISGGTTSGIATSTYVTSACSSPCTGSSITSAPIGIVLTFDAGGNAGPYSAPSPFAFDINANDSQGESVGAGHYANASVATYTPTWNATNFANQGYFSIDIP